MRYDFLLRGPLVWPGLVPVPPTVRKRVRISPDGIVSYQGPVGVGLGVVPPETFLRQLDAVDVDDPDSVVAFVEEHGVVEPRYFPRLALRFADTPPPGWRGVVPGDPLRFDDLVRLLRTARAGVGHWIRNEGGEDVAGAWRAEGVDVDSATTADWSSEFEAWKNFDRAINVGLAHFHVRVEALGPGPLPDLYSVLCLQLANHIAEGVTTRVCANEPCGRRFVRQLGGAAHGQHRLRGGVMYCTPQCARAQAQRERRRRRRQEGDTR